MEYRIFVLDDEDQATRLFNCEAETDLQALDRARDVAADAYAVEVWKDGRLVERLGGDVQ